MDLIKISPASASCKRTLCFSKQFSLFCFFKISSER